MPADRAGSAYERDGYADANGREIDVSNLDCGQKQFSDCLASAHLTYRLETYVADSQYPQMMLTISGIHLLFAGAFLGAQGLAERPPSGGEAADFVPQKDRFPKHGSSPTASEVPDVVVGTHLVPQGFQQGPLTGFVEHPTG